MAVILGLNVSFVLPAILFTLLAVIIGSSFFKKPKPSKKKEDAPVKRDEKVEHFKPKEEPIVVLKEEPKEEPKAEVAEHKEPEVAAVAPVVEEIGVVEEQPATEPEIPSAPEEPVPEPEVEKEPEPEPEPEPAPKPAPEEESIPELIPGTEPESLDKPEDTIDGRVEHDLSPKYSPGKKRTTQFEEMMTKEELEEEQSMEE